MHIYTYSIWTSESNSCIRQNKEVNFYTWPVLETVEVESWRWWGWRCHQVCRIVGRVVRRIRFVVLGLGWCNILVLIVRDLVTWFDIRVQITESKQYVEYSIYWEYAQYAVNAKYAWYVEYALICKICDNDFPYAE